MTQHNLQVPEELLALALDTLERNRLKPSELAMTDVLQAILPKVRERLLGEMSAGPANAFEEAFSTVFPPEDSP